VAHQGRSVKDRCLLSRGCEDGDVDGGLAGGAVDGAAGVVLGYRALDHAGAGPEPSREHQAGQDGPADGPCQVDGGAGGDARGQDDLVAGGVQGDREAGPVGVGARESGGGVGDGGAQGLVGDEQGPDLLLDAVGCAGAQDAAAEDGGLELEVAGLYFPALPVEDYDFPGRVAKVRARRAASAAADLRLETSRPEFRCGSSSTR